MESLRLYHLVSLILVYISTNCVVFGERVSKTIQYQCAEYGICTCSEGLYDPFYTGIITIDCSNRNLTLVPDLIGLPKFKYYRFLLTDNHIQFVHPRDFRYSMFIEINLGGSNTLVQVADKAFVATSRYLKKLTLNIGQLNVYKLRFLHGVTKIRELTLEGSGNKKQTTLPRRVFPGYKLKSMRRLTITGLGLTKIAPDAFLGVRNVEFLSLSRNSLPYVPTTALKGLTQLSELDLTHNRLRTLEKNPFSQLVKLSKLDMSHNFFNGTDAIVSDTFIDLKNCLKTLIITNSSLSVIPSESLRNLKVLSHLNISDNQIQDIGNNSGPFRGKSKLRELDISGNDLELSEALFEGLEFSLRRLFIRRMKLKDIPKHALNNFTQLHYLDMSRNMLGHLPTGFNKGVFIRHFILRDMYITGVSSGAFVKPAPTAKLHVDLSSNRLTSVGFISDTKPCTFVEVEVENNPILCDCALYRALSDDTINVRGRCSGGGEHFQHVSFSDIELTDTLRRVCIIPETDLDPCRRLDAQWRAHKQFSGVISIRGNLKLTTMFLCGAMIFIFAEIRLSVL